MMLMVNPFGDRDPPEPAEPLDGLPEAWSRTRSFLGTTLLERETGSRGVPAWNGSQRSSWNPTDPCFDRKGPGLFGWLVVQNRGHSGSRYIYLSIHPSIHPSIYLSIYLSIYISLCVCARM